MPRIFIPVLELLCGAAGVAGIAATTRFDMSVVPFGAKGRTATHVTPRLTRRLIYLGIAIALPIPTAVDTECFTPSVFDGGKDGMRRVR